MSVRERLAADLEKDYDSLIKLIRDAMVATKKVSVERDCLKCGCTHKMQIEIPNAVVAMQAAEFIANQGFGRPGTVEPDVERAAPVFVRNVIFEQSPEG